jgi:uncharacterized tellurite resistance protein B-like protein
MQRFDMAMPATHIADPRLEQQRREQQLRASVSGDGWVTGCTPVLQDNLRMFRYFDVDADGRIPMGELRDRMQSHAQQIGLNADQLQQLIMYADKNQDQFIDFSEFSILVS